MPGTHTPSAAAWNNTSQYVLTGETITETVAKDAGTKAMDNLAYLTGANTNSAIRRVAVLASVAAIKAIAAADRRDDDTIVFEDRGLYKFDSGSSATGDDWRVITPTAGTGRWLRQGIARQTPIVLGPSALTAGKVSGATQLSIAWEVDVTDWFGYSTGADATARTGVMPLAGLLIPGDIITLMTLYTNRTAGEMSASMYYAGNGSATFVGGCTVNAGTGAQNDDSGVLAHTVLANKDYFLRIGATNSSASADMKLHRIEIAYTPIG